MENYSFKTVTFGGFDKQDVVRYLEQAAEKAAKERQELEKEIEELRKRTAEQAVKTAALEDELRELTVQRDELQARLEAETTARRGLEPLRSLKGEVARLSAEADALRPDAEAYARFRERLGAIEFEARNRADDLEEAAASRTRRTAETFTIQYRKLMTAFNAAAAHVTQELQGIEAALAQLPRSMDAAETELNALTAGLQKGPDGRAVLLSRRRESAPAGAAGAPEKTGPEAKAEEPAAEERAASPGEARLEDARNRRFLKRRGE